MIKKIKKIVSVSLLLLSQTLFSRHVIDVVIPCHKKDRETLEFVIEGIKKNIHARRIIIISKEKLTDKAEWFNESLYPFCPSSIALEIFNGDATQATQCVRQGRAIGWVFQQLLKLYAPIIIPGISEHVLMLDADTIFLKKVSFIDKDGYALYNTRKGTPKPYLEHIQRLLPDLKIISREHRLGGVCHHMLFQRSVIENLFNEIQLQHKCDPWKALCRCMDKKYLYRALAMSEYELYFNFVFAHNYKAKIRKLKSIDIKLSDRATVENKDYDYISCHHYLNKIKL